MLRIGSNTGENLRVRVMRLKKSAEYRLSPAWSNPTRRKGITFSVRVMCNLWISLVKPKTCTSQTSTMSLHCEIEVVAPSPLRKLEHFSDSYVALTCGEH